MAANARPALCHFAQHRRYMVKVTVSILFFLTLMACRTEPVETIYHDFALSGGVYIANEGNFMYGNSSLSFYQPDQKKVYNHIYQARNRAPLGDVAQSVTLYGELLYVVVNNSGKVVAVDRRTLEHKKTLTGLVSPRYMHIVGPGKAYLSDLYSGEIAVVDLINHTITGSIDVYGSKVAPGVRSTEHFVQWGHWVFVTAWSEGRQVLVIDTTTDRLVDAISVPRQPRYMLLDKNEKLWVLTDGTFPGAPGGFEPPSLVRIDPYTLTVEQIFGWPSGEHYPGDLGINPTRDTLYIMAGGVYCMAVTDTQLPREPWVEARGRLFYRLGIDAVSGDIYIADAIDYRQNALVHRISRSAVPIDSFRVGVNPGHFLFHNTNSYQK